MWKQDWNPFYKPDPKEVVRKCQANIKKEVRSIERQMMGARGRRQRAQEVIRRPAPTAQGAAARQGGLTAPAAAPVSMQT